MTDDSTGAVVGGGQRAEDKRQALRQWWCSAVQRCRGSWPRLRHQRPEVNALVEGDEQQYE